jgi:hypothetical protein
MYWKRSTFARIIDGVESVRHNGQNHERLQLPRHRAEIANGKVQEDDVHREELERPSDNEIEEHVDALLRQRRDQFQLHQRYIEKKRMSKTAKKEKDMIHVVLKKRNKDYPRGSSRCHLAIRTWQSWRATASGQTGTKCPQLAPQCSSQCGESEENSSAKLGQCCFTSH